MNHCDHEKSLHSGHIQFLFNKIINCTNISSCNPGKFKACSFYVPKECGHVFMRNKKIAMMVFYLKESFKSYLVTKKKEVIFHISKSTET